jgi:hypothetical protein
MTMSRIENDAVGPRALCDEQLDAVSGGESKPKGGGGFNIKFYTEQMTFDIREYDA